MILRVAQDFSFTRVSWRPAILATIKRLHMYMGISDAVIKGWLNYKNLCDVFY